MLTRKDPYSMLRTLCCCLAIAVLLLAACSPAAEPETKAPDAAAPAPAPAPAASANPHLGTWVLNVGKSSYSPGPAPKSQTIKMEAWDADGVSYVADGCLLYTSPSPRDS